MIYNYKDYLFLILFYGETIKLFASSTVTNTNGKFFMKFIFLYYKRVGVHWCVKASCLFICFLISHVFHEGNIIIIINMQTLD